MDELPLERHYPLAPLAKRCGFTLAHFKALLRKKGVKVRRFSDRGLRIPESELLRFLNECALTIEPPEGTS